MKAALNFFSVMFACSRTVIFLEISSFWIAPFPDHLAREEEAFVGAFVSVPTGT